MEYQLTQKLQYIENIGLKLMADMEEIKKQLSNLQNANRTTQTIAKDSATEVKKLQDNVEIHRQLLMELKSGYNANQPRVPAGSSEGGQWSGSGSSGGGATVRLRRTNSNHENSSYYDPKTGIYDPPINPVYPIETVIGFGSGVIYAAQGARSAYNLYRVGRYINKARQIPKGVSKIGKNISDLSVDQNNSLKRFCKRNKNYNPNIKVTNYSDGSSVYSFKVLARDIPKSYAIYEKYVDKSGRMIRTNKITIGPKGELVHIKNK